MSMTLFWSMEMSPSMERSIKSESLFSPHRFLSTVLISLSFENDRSTEAVVTGMVAYVLRSMVRLGKTDYTSDRKSVV